MTSPPPLSRRPAWPWIVLMLGLPVVALLGRTVYDSRIAFDIAHAAWWFVFLGLYLPGWRSLLISTSFGTFAVAVTSDQDALAIVALGAGALAIAQTWNARATRRRRWKPMIATEASRALDGGEHRRALERTFE